MRRDRRVPGGPGGRATLYLRRADPAGRASVRARRQPGGAQAASPGRLQPGLRPMAHRDEERDQRRGEEQTPMQASAQCGDSGYQEIKATTSSDVAAVTPGSSHVLHAERIGDEIYVWADGELAWVGTLPEFARSAPRADRRSLGQRRALLRAARAGGVERRSRRELPLARAQPQERSRATGSASRTSRTFFTSSDGEKAFRSSEKSCSTRTPLRLEAYSGRCDRT